MGEMEFLARCMYTKWLVCMRFTVIGAIIFRYRHPRVVQIIGVCVERCMPSMVMELMHSSLMHHLHQVTLMISSDY